MIDPDRINRFPLFNSFRISLSLQKQDKVLQNPLNLIRIRRIFDAFLTIMPPSGRMFMMVKLEAAVSSAYFIWDWYNLNYCLRSSQPLPQGHDSALSYPMRISPSSLTPVFSSASILHWNSVGFSRNPGQVCPTWPGISPMPYLSLVGHEVLKASELS